MKQSAACGLAKSSFDLRLRRLVLKTKPRASSPFRSTILADGLPSEAVVANVIAWALGSPFQASSSHRRKGVNGSTSAISSIIHFTSAAIGFDPLRSTLFDERRGSAPTAAPVRSRFEHFGEKRGDSHAHGRTLRLDDPIHRRRHLPLPRCGSLYHPPAGKRQMECLVKIVQGRGLGSPGEYPAPILGVSGETGLGKRLHMFIDHRRCDTELGGELRG